MIGRTNESKMDEKYEGPFQVKQVWSNNLTYVLERVNENGEVGQVRAHQKQLRGWRMPPKYLVMHPAYGIWKENESWLENDSGMNGLNDKEIVLVKKKGKKSKRRSIQKEVPDIEGKSTIDWGTSTEGSFEGFWLEDNLFDESLMNVEKSVRVSIIQDSIVDLCKSLQSECDFEGFECAEVDVNNFCKDVRMILDRIVRGIRESISF